MGTPREPTGQSIGLHIRSTEPLGHLVGLAFDTNLVRSRDQQRCALIGQQPGLGLRGVIGRAFDDDVRIRSTDAERGDARPGPVIAQRPGLRFVGHLDRARGPVDVAARAVGIECLRHPAVLHGEYHLDDATDSGSRLGMGDVGLERAQEHWRADAVGAVGGQNRLGLNRVAQGGSSAVGLDDVDIIRGERSIREGIEDHAALSGAIGGGEPV